MNKLYRSRRDKRITGLLGGLAEKFNIDATLLRLVVAIATIFSGGTIVPLYIIASIVIPKEPHYPYDPYANPYDRPGYGPYGEPFQRDPYQGEIRRETADTPIHGGRTLTGSRLIGPVPNHPMKYLKQSLKTISIA
ncbi:PspC domain-containing protein [Paenibacillus larvae]|nr:PspC domain-containing protein [Paenibacillus larvae]MDT2240199.1 PspC domain-containing protein [Paenibacillus larvae]MDT2294443.1 PspC domain-containing protein [Paenibacillus larvae]MDT2303359.1 PspC domain-containing protein [Paenibacillus larvae]